MGFCLWMNVVGLSLRILTGRAHAYNSFNKGYFSPIRKNANRATLRVDVLGSSTVNLRVNPCFPSPTGVGMLPAWLPIVVSVVLFWLAGSLLLSSGIGCVVAGWQDLCPLFSTCPPRKLATNAYAVQPPLVGTLLDGRDG